MKAKFHPKAIIGLSGIVMTAVMLLLISAGTYIQPEAKLLIAAEENRQSLDSPLTIQFSVPIARRLLQPTITPPIEGEWHWNEGIAGSNHLSRKLVFIPETIWEADKQYTVTFDGVAPILSRSTEKQTLSFTTKSLPTIVSASISEGQVDVAPDEPLTFELDQSTKDVAEFYFRLEPEAEVVVERGSNSDLFVVKPKEALKQGQQYKVIIDREVIAYSKTTELVTKRFEKETIFERVFRTKTPPELISVEPQGQSILPNVSELHIQFSQAMDRNEFEKMVQLQPSIAGAWHWKSDTEVNYRLSSPLSIATKYSIIIPKGTQSKTGSFFESDSVLHFSTVGAVRVISFSPSKKTGISLLSPITITFDQPVDEASTLSKIEISPSIDTYPTWKNNTLTLQPKSPLLYNTTYSVTVKPTIKSKFALDSNTTFKHSFTTEEKVVLLNIAWDRQDRALSCEAAALKMALAGKGVFVSENDIMDKIGYDPTPRGSNSWGDPDEAFVGDINGAQNTTGYGVHWNPIARAAQAWRSAKAVTGMSLSDAARELEAGNPIVIWGVTGPSYYDPWTTPSGKKIEAWKGEHARTLIGFKGSVENPTSFIINDPQAGRVTWSAEKLKSNWATFNNAGVIVY